MTSPEPTPTSDETREPTALEAAIRQGQAGASDMQEVISQFVNSTIVVPTATEVKDDMNELQPVLFDREGTQMLAVFTHIDRVPQQVAEVAGYAVELPAAEFVQAIPAEAGLVVNPGNEEGFEMLPEGVQQLANDVRGMIAAMAAAQGVNQDDASSSDQPPASTKVDPSAIPNF
ncbi:SseB family protein [Frondihabitans australicus]|uniref:Type III secretion system (T3SS) SseB-like protein n=1 Tax=Frondihabitans australicus TaxID=386892 RepID=A0A495IIH7_9MICO|nr:SseB family protein [Frondihabitans australicus]RKR74915.1 type III secretion system (T3SS) SseB-like protein [Frondihabitans australicus]